MRSICHSAGTHLAYACKLYKYLQVKGLGSITSSKYIPFSCTRQKLPWPLITVQPVFRYNSLWCSLPFVTNDFEDVMHGLSS